MGGQIENCKNYLVANSKDRYEGVKQPTNTAEKFAKVRFFIKLICK
jgi:hypothetical protein